MAEIVKELQFEKGCERKKSRPPQWTALSS